MTISEFKKVGRLLKDAYRELEAEALSNDVDIFGEEYRVLMDKTRELVLSSLGFTLEEYREAKNSLEEERVSKVLEKKVSPQVQELQKSINDVESKIPTIPEPEKVTYDSLPDKPKIISRDEVSKLVDEKISQIPKSKPLIQVTRPITKIEKTTERVEYDDSKLLKKIDDVKKLIPEPTDIEAIKSYFQDYFSENFKHNIDTLGMPDFRKLAMGLREDIDKKLSISQLIAGTNITITDNGNGTYTISSTGSGPVTANVYWDGTDEYVDENGNAYED